MSSRWYKSLIFISLGLGSTPLWAWTAPVFYSSNLQGAQSHGAIGLEWGLAQKTITAPTWWLDQERPKLFQVALVKGLQVPLDLSFVYTFNDKLGLTQASAFAQGTLFQELGLPALAIKAGKHRLWHPDTKAFDGHSLEGVVSFARLGFNFYALAGWTTHSLGSMSATPTDALGLEWVLKEPFIRLQTELRRHASRLSSIQLGLIFGH